MAQKIKDEKAKKEAAEKAALLEEEKNEKKAWIFMVIINWIKFYFSGI